MSFDGKSNYYCNGGVEVIDVIEKFDLNFARGNAAKYIMRCGRKGTPADARRDAEKALAYIRRETKRACMRVYIYECNTGPGAKSLAGESLRSLARYFEEIKTKFGLSEIAGAALSYLLLSAWYTGTSEVNSLIEADACTVRLIEALGETSETNDLRGLAEYERNA